MKLTYYGHSAFRIETQQARILVDPFFTGNVNAPEGALEEASKDLTHICLTHGHWDHVGDTVDLARKTGATVVCNVDLANWLKAKGVEKIDMGNTGGTLHHDGFSLTFVQAVHSAAGMDENGVSQDLGPANGLVFHFHDGPCIYNMGDTDIFGDMALIAELHQPDIGIVPIGDRFTMGGAVAMASEPSAPGLEELRNSVTSKGGTTAAGLDALNSDDGLSDRLHATLQAAYDRAVELR